MEHSQHKHSNDDNGGNWFCSRMAIATLVALAIMAFLIYQGHGAHMLGYFPFLLILACPVMHIFMHGGHGSRSSHRDGERPNSTSNQQEDKDKNSRRVLVMEHATDIPAYGLWGLVILNSIIFIGFAFSFFKPETKTDWRSFNMFSAFIIALFVEMYGFPLSIYLFSGWLAKNYPGVDFFTHDNGHLLHTLFGLKDNPHWDIFHIMSNIFIFGGFLMLSSAWNVLWRAQRHKKLATKGIYAYVRHPQYVAFIAIMLGFLLQWPTLVALVMFPILTFMYIRLALKEEKIVEKEFGDDYFRWAAVTPRFIPRLFKPKQNLNEKKL